MVGAWGDKPTRYSDIRISFLYNELNSFEAGRYWYSGSEKALE